MLVLLRALFVLAAVQWAMTVAIETMGETVRENPTEEELDTGLSDLMRSISSIHNHLRNMSITPVGNLSAVIDEEIKNGIGAVTKDITYDNLIDKIKQAKSKIKEIQDKVSKSMLDLERNWPEANITRHHP